MKNLYACLVLFLALGLASCKEESSSPTIDYTLNAPVVTSAIDSYSYTVHANQFSDNVQSVVNFSSDSLVITIASTEYLSGQAIVSVRDTLNALIFADTVKSNKTVAITGLKTTRPKNCSVVLTNLTGKLVFAVVGQ